MTKTVSLETARLLKEAGWETKTKDYWYCQVGGVVVDTECRGEWELRENANLNIGFGEYVPAPDVSELLEALPEGWEYPIRIQDTNVGKRRVTVGMRELKGSVAVGDWKANARGDTPAEALALLWLELRKQKLLPNKE